MAGIPVYEQDLHWALKSVNITYNGLFGSLGLFRTLQGGQVEADKPVCPHSPTV